VTRGCFFSVIHPAYFFADALYEGAAAMLTIE